MAIAPLSKITATLTIIDADNEQNAETRDIEFIYGVGSGGLTDFEIALGQVPPGTPFELSLSPGDTGSVFKHLRHLIGPLPDAPGPLVLKTTVTRTGPAENREVVRAMAESQQCGSGCDCGCGH